MILTKTDPSRIRYLRRELRLVFLHKESSKSDQDLWSSCSNNLNNIQAAELLFWSKGEDGIFHREKESSLIDLQRSGCGYSSSIVLRLPIRKGRYPALRVRHQASYMEPQAMDKYSIVYPSLSIAYNSDNNIIQKLPVTLRRLTVRAGKESNADLSDMQIVFNCMDSMYPWDSTDPV